MPTTRPILVPIGHSNVITALAFSADGRTLVSGSYDQTAIVWDVLTGTMRRLFPLREFVNGLALTPDGRTLVTDEGRVWDVDTGQIVRTSRNYISPLACSPDGQTLASSAFNPHGDGWVILVSDIRSGRKRRMFPCGTFQPEALAFSADGALVAATGREEQESEVYADVTTVCELKTGTIRRTLPGQNVVALFGRALTPHTRLTALTREDMKLWDAETGECLYTIPMDASMYSPIDIPRVALSPDGRLLALGMTSGRVSVYDLPTSSLRWQTQAHQGWLRTVVFTTDGHTLATGGDDHVIHLWDAHTGTHQRAFPGQGPATQAVAFTPDGSGITALYKDYSARLWNLDTPRLERWERDYGEMLHIPIDNNTDTARHLWNLISKQLPERYPPGIVTVSQDGSLVALQDREHNLQIWDTATGKSQSAIQDDSGPWNAYAFSPDNRYLAVCSGNPKNLVRVYDAQTGDIAKDLTLHDDVAWWPVELRFSPDSRLLAVGHADYAIVLWEMSTGRRKRLLSAYRDCINTLAFSPDGKTLAVGTAYWEVVWLKRLGREGKQRFLRGHSADIRSVDYAPDGSLLATGAEDGTVRVWNPESGALLATFLPLSDEEWIIYTPEGYYTGSPGVEQHFLWRQGSDLSPGDMFAAVYRVTGERMALLLR